MKNDHQTGFSAMAAEVQDVLQGAVKAAAHDQQASSRIESMKSLTRDDWKEAARRLLLSHRTGILEAMSLPTLEAVAFGYVDVRSVLHIASASAEEDAAEDKIREIAARRLNMDFDEGGSAVSRLEAALVHDALLEAYVSGQNTRSA